MQTSTFVCFLSTSLMYCTLGQTVTQSPLNVLVGEGMEVPLSCSYDQTAYNLFWYIQKPGHTMKMLLNGLNKDSDLEEEYRGRVFFTSDKTKKIIPLNITKIRMSDTGTYYCVFSATLCQVHEQDAQ
ncbi:unnamed protein product [Ranitomeya imitator]|uniref:Ig-like domain-containing protein n=1 Tax=Ranitomeya imitator TaxID=111125 RepID=A0ABN9KZB0_9NEOB|nr:unnamed protein product [Ranitomeya imitator]